MKHLSRFLIASLLVFGLTSVNAQDQNNPWSITIGSNAVDFFPVGDTDGFSPVERGSFGEELFNANDHWNFIPSVANITVSRYIGDNFSVGVTGSYNTISRFGGRETVEDLQLYTADARVTYSFNKIVDNIIGAKWLDPYLGVGAGASWLEREDTEAVVAFGTANGTGGVKIWLAENWNVDLASTFKYAFEDENPARDYFQYTFGIGYSFGGKDTDGDGIYDRDDECPEVAGLAQFNGCPDSDGDGIQDSKDACPQVFGLADFEGCPDSDGDGIPDPKDACPTVAGTAALGGCPDADGDGIKDSDDSCPNESGPRANNGCPYQDKDGDGVLDKDDNCPDVAGTVANDGCPEISVEVVNELNVQFKSVLFDNAKASIRAESYSTLDNVASIMQEYPRSRFLIEGHTDSRGRDAYNQKLSDERAASVLNYLIGKGISSSRLQSKGFGETQPIASNDTAAGRQENRRVQLSILKN